MNAQYLQLEQGFIKRATELGVEEPFLKGYLATAQGISDAWSEKIAQVEKDNNDPQFRVKLAHDIIMSSPKITKVADLESIMNSLHSGLGGLGQSLGGGEGLGGMIGGGGGGAIIGLLLAKLLGLPPMVGLLLGGLGGGFLGHQFGNHNIGATAGNPAHGLPNGQPQMPGQGTGEGFDQKLNDNADAAVAAQHLQQQAQQVPLQGSGKTNNITPPFQTPNTGTQTAANGPTIPGKPIVPPAATQPSPPPVSTPAPTSQPVAPSPTSTSMTPPGAAGSTPPPIAKPVAPKAGQPGGSPMPTNNPYFPK
jgi:hypothetical protein